MKERFADGIWLGTRKRTDEHVIATVDGDIVFTRSVRIQPEENQWNFDWFNSIRGTPWNHKGDKEKTSAVPKVIPFIEAR